MYKQKKIWLQQFLLTVCVFTIFACNENEPKKTGELVTTNEGDGKNPQSANVTFTGKLDILCVDTTDFNKLENEKRVMFSHIYMPSEKLLTLHGWITKGNMSAPINLPPDIKLLKWKADTISVEQNLYLGNVFIEKKDIKKIKDAYRNGPKYRFVVFVPILDAQHIMYKIYVSNDPPAPLTGGPSPSNLTDTGLDANPSPPREN